SPTEGFLITPSASLPFKGTLSDDHGLARAGWLHEVREVDIELIGGAGGGKDRLPLLVLHGNTGQRRAGPVASSLQLGPRNLLTPNRGRASLAFMARFLQLDLAQSAGRGEVYVPMDVFREAREARADKDLPLTALQAALEAEKAPPRLAPWSHQLKDE